MKYLLTEQHDLKFTEEFLGQPAVKSAIFQALQDGAGERFSEDKIFEYREKLSRSRHEKSNDDLPFNSHVDGAQRLIYQRVLDLNGWHSS